MFGRTKFYLQHVDTGKYLDAFSNYKYTNKNCPNCPVVDHGEVSASSTKKMSNLWKVHSGFFFPENLS